MLITNLNFVEKTLRKLVKITINLIIKLIIIELILKLIKCGNLIISKLLLIILRFL